MVDTVLFPARRSARRLIEEEEGRIPFEIFSSKGSTPVGATYLGLVTLQGVPWKRSLKNLSLGEYREFRQNTYRHLPDTSEYFSGNLFQKHFSRAKIPSVMGIVNATPDSFFPESRTDGDIAGAIDRIVDGGADIIDVGGESTRPGSARVSAETEIERIRPALEYLSSSFDVPISVDTRNPQTLEFALNYGIKYANDISGFRDKRMIDIAANNDLESVAMHMKGEPYNMSEFTAYTDILFEINLFFMDTTEKMMEGGIKPSKIILDPGIGFSKKMEGSLEIINNLGCFNMGYRILAGASRKGFIGKITGEPVEARLPGTIATSICLMVNKADIIRVHDVKENRDALKVYASIDDSDR